MAQTPVIVNSPVGAPTIEYRAAADKTAGDVVLVGTVPMIVKRDIDYSEDPLGTVTDGRGDVDWLMPQKAEVITAGDRVYWDPTGNPYGGTSGSGAVTATPTGYPIGIAAPSQPNGTNATAATDKYVRCIPNCTDVAPSSSGTTGTTFTVDSDSATPKIALGSQAGGTGDYTLTIKPAATLTGNRTVLVPDASDTLVNLGSTQTLTAKTLTAPVINSPTGVRTVEAHTAGDTLAATESRSTHANTGASGTITIVLPAATAGQEFTFHVGAAQELRIDPNGSETIALPSTGAQGAAGKYLVADAVGEWVKLVCVIAGSWQVEGYFGTWTAES